MTPKKFDSINVVPMIDIMLVLLVIVLTTATFIAKGIIPLELPEGSSASAPTHSKPIEISVSKEGEIYIGEEKIPATSLQEKLSAIDRNETIYISCDKEAPYLHFVNILDGLKKSGHSKINIVTRK